MVDSMLLMQFFHYVRTQIDLMVDQVLEIIPQDINITKMKTNIDALEEETKIIMKMIEI